MKHSKDKNKKLYVNDFDEEIIQNNSNEDNLSILNSNSTLYPDYLRKVYNFIDDRERRASLLPSNYLDHMKKVTSVAMPSSRKYKGGDKFISKVTGFDLIVDESFANEKHEHLEYLFCFRVFKEFNDEDTALDINFNYTMLKQRRRLPFLTKDSLWNYRPTLCNNPRGECPSRDTCSYCHSTDELIYHPLVFKTKHCDEPLDEYGCCTKFGRHCAKSHCESDKRVPYNHKQNQNKIKNYEQLHSTGIFDDDLNNKIEEFKDLVYSNLSENDKIEVIKKFDELITIARRK